MKTADFVLICHKTAFAILTFVRAVQRWGSSALGWRELWAVIITGWSGVPIFPTTLSQPAVAVRLKMAPCWWWWHMITLWVGACRSYCRPYSTFGQLKLNDEVLAWSSVWSKVQIVCIWCSWCHGHPITPSFLASLKPRWFYRYVSDFSRLSRWKAIKRT